MEIHVLNSVLVHDGDAEALQAIWGDMMKLVADAQMIVSGVHVDGQELLEEDFLQYIIDEASHIRKIEVQTVHVKEAMDGILVMMQEYLQRALPELSNVINKFYSDSTKYEWLAFQDFLEALQWIFSSISPLSTNSQLKGLYPSASVLESATRELQTKVQLIEEALVDQDYTLLADVLQYEVYPALEKLNQQLGQTIDTEVVKRGLV